MRKYFVLVLLILVAPAPAQASTVRVDDRPVDPDGLVFTAAPGERNQVSAERVSPTVLIVRDAGSVISPGAGCVSVAVGVQCSTTTGASLELNAFLGDEDDLATADGTIDGGRGDDRITGSGSFTGGPGDDVLVATGYAYFADGDGRHPGHDVYRGAGEDHLSYQGRPAPVRVDLRAHHTSEDRVTGVKFVQGSEGDDVLIGDDNANTLDGGAGADRISGLAGDDILYAGFAGGGGDVLDRGAGDDSLTGGSVNGVLRCGAGDDDVSPGQDRIEDCESVDELPLRTSLPSADAPILRLSACNDYDCHVPARIVLHHGARVVGSVSVPQQGSAQLRLNSLGRRLLRRDRKLTVRIAQKNGCSFVLRLGR